MNNELERLDPSRVVAGLAGGDSSIKAAAAQNPSMALEVIATVYILGGASLPVLARALDNTLGLIADPVEACKLLDDHLTQEAQAEMVAIHGDRLSVVVQVADPAVIVAALEFDAAPEFDADGQKKRVLVSASLLVLAWAQNVSNRTDWEEILQQEIGETNLRDLLIAAVYASRLQGADEAGLGISPDQWDDVGLEPTDASDRLQELIASDVLPRFSSLDEAAARKRLRDLRRAFEKDISHEVVVRLLKDIDI